jgi:hypothetical protein
MRQNRDDHEKARPLVGVYSFTLTKKADREEP